MQFADGSFKALNFYRLTKIRSLLVVALLYHIKGAMDASPSKCLLKTPELLNGGERGIRTLGTTLVVHAISSRAPSASSDISP